MYINFGISLLGRLKFMKLILDKILLTISYHISMYEVLRKVSDIIDFYSIWNYVFYVINNFFLLQVRLNSDFIKHPVLNKHA